MVMISSPWATVVHRGRGWGRGMKETTKTLLTNCLCEKKRTHKVQCGPWVDAMQIVLLDLEEKGPLVHLVVLFAPVEKCPITRSAVIQVNLFFQHVSA